jgi:hypothetical protein
MFNPMMNFMNMPFSGNDRICDCAEGLRTHKVPRVPIMIDEKEVDPMLVREFTGHPLHTVVDTDGLKGKMLKIFTTKDKALAFSKHLPKKDEGLKEQRSKLEGVGTSQQALTAGIPPDGGYIELYEHVDFGGCAWRLLEYNNHTVANYGNLWACGFLWWGWKNANNTVSSIDVRVSADLVSFCDGPNINLSSAIWFPGDSWITNLVMFGWNDRISSHLLWYF